MTVRFRKTTACLLLAAWPLVLGLATGWHTHSHRVTCGQNSCRAHRHAHGDHHHGQHNHHHASHTHSEDEPRDEDSSPCSPHRSDDCRSCQLLALSGIATQTLPLLPSLPVGETTGIAVIALPELEAPGCLHLRGPPAGMTV